MIITHSSLECFKQCRQKYFHRYMAGITPIVKSDALLFGSAVHEVLQTIFETIESNQDSENHEERHSLLIRLQCMINAMNMPRIEIAKLTGLIIGYMNKWYDSDCAEYEVIDVEREFSYPLSKREHETTLPVSFVGKVDGILKRKSDGKYFILEHKTASIVDEDYISQKQIDAQTMTYAAFIGKTMEIEVSGAIHDIITKQKIRLKKGESEEEFCDRLIADVNDDNFNRIIVEFDKQELSDFSLELSHAIDDVTHCDSYYKCTGACLGRYGACEYLPLCRNKCDLHGVESLYEQKQKVFEEISDETLKQGA